ncbi:MULTISPECIES: GntR family transcriptional regulator [Clostridium]|uniref:GntR family transcriptional regulator n=1 Tax=Clostridium senegalense TaxID=1465809 RepID=A0A6M0H7W9_9CLOT|nr:MULTISPECIES: GntR family transcriptional regulator [Clostridium]NEU06143.1 GntR family transcriptional regulator [Clostridium senegalense]
MNFVVNDKEPIYLQIIRHVKQSIVKGDLMPGDTIPSRRELAEMLKVNPNTVQRAYKEMESMRVINTVRNFPSSITADEKIINGMKRELIDNALVDFIESMKAINVSKEEVIKIIEERY